MIETIVTKQTRKNCKSSGNRCVMEKKREKSATKRTEKRQQSPGYNLTGLLFATGGAVLVTVILIMGVFQMYLKRFQGEKGGQTYEEYYVMLTQDKKSDFWQAIYESAYLEGLSQGVYIDLLSNDLSQDYSIQELMDIAIYAKVDGIIVEADESLRMTEQINKAVSAGIPVVTLYGDNTQSERCSYVGLGYYDIGREYGRQILRIAGEKGKSQNVAMLVEAGSEKTSQNIVISGIQETIAQENTDETLSFQYSMIAVDGASDFTVEESIRDLFMQEEIPDIIVCLGARDTACVYQAVVDYNKVGQVSILGYYTSEAILKGIDRGVIDATIMVDTAQMGRYCVDALKEYKSLGNTSEYFAADISLIDKNNIEQYMGDSADE